MNSLFFSSKKKTIKFVLLSRYRSGSNLLLKGLEQSTQISVYPELFNLIYIHKNPEKYLDPQIVYEGFNFKNENIKASGFKLMYDQATEVELEDDFFYPIEEHPFISAINLWLTENNLPKSSFNHIWETIKNDRSIKIIHLYRNNQLESYASFQLALSQNNWIAKPFDPNSKIKLDKYRLEQWFINGLEKKSFYNQFYKDHDVLNINYEDLSNKYEEVLKKCMAFLKCKPLANYKPLIPKQNRIPLNIIIENYYELEDYFKNTQWSNYFKT